MKLINNDCLIAMAEMPDASVDLTVTSPPYDNLRTYNGNIAQWNEQVWKAVIAELFRLTKQGGVVVWVVGDATVNGSETGTSFKQALWAMECGFNLHDTMIYQKQGCALPSPNRYLQSFEYMFVFSNGKPITYNLIGDRKNRFERWGKTKKVREKDGSFSIRQTKPFLEYGRRFNVWRIATGGQGYQTSDNNSFKHPATFPEQLANDHIISWSNEGDTVFDPFMGSGTTGVACANINRNFIGIELEIVYFAIAQKRINDVITNGQKKLF